MSEKKKGIMIIAAAAVAAASIIIIVALAVALPFYQNNDDNSNKNPETPGHNDTAPAQPPPGGANGTTTTTSEPQGGAPVKKATVNVLSSPSALPFVEKWVAEYNSEENLGNVQVSYSDRVDDAKMPLLYSNFSAFLADHSADLAIAGRPVAAIKEGDFTYAGSAFLPVAPQAVAVVYNIPAIPDVASGLRLDPPTLYAVLSGNATYWDDPRIKSLNPGTRLPHEQIVVVHEGAEGSASDMLGRYLAPVSNGTGIAWPESSRAADSTNSLSATVRQMPYSIGYVDFAFAIQTRMTFASLQNSDGKYILPSSDSIGAAVRNGTAGMAAADTAPIDDGTSPENRAPADAVPPVVSIGQLGNGSYPVVGFYYAAFPDSAVGANETAGAGGSKDAATVDFVRWIVGSEGQQVLKDLQYPSVYEQNKRLEAFADRALGGRDVSSLTTAATGEAHS